MYRGEWSDQLQMKIPKAVLDAKQHQKHRNHHVACVTVASSAAQSTGFVANHWKYFKLRLIELLSWSEL